MVKSNLKEIKLKTFMLRKEDVDRKWYHVDASGKIVGRLASEIAKKLMGKGKSTYTFHTDNGDFVVVTNTKGVVMTNNKGKVYYRHSTKPGNLKRITFREMMDKDATRVLSLAVKRMLPKNRIGRHMFGRLRLFEAAEHSHVAQKPIEMEVK